MELIININGDSNETFKRLQGSGDPDKFFKI
jgi:hypothetical protein